MTIPKPTKIVDFLLTRVGGLDRGDLEARLKNMRADGLWPSARRVADRSAEAVTSRHCSNLILGILGSNTAIGAAVAAGTLAELPIRAKAEVVDNVFVSPVATNEKPTTLGDFLERVIKQSRASDRSWPSNVGIGELVVHHGNPGSAFLYFCETDKDENQSKSRVVEFGNPQHADDPALRLHEHRSIDCVVVHAMAEFLGPLEHSNRASTSAEAVEPAV